MDLRRFSASRANFDGRLVQICYFCIYEVDWVEPVKIGDTTKGIRPCVVLFPLNNKFNEYPWFSQECLQRITGLLTEVCRFESVSTTPSRREEAIVDLVAIPGK